MELRLTYSGDTCTLCTRTHSAFLQQQLALEVFAACLCQPVHKQTEAKRQSKDVKFTSVGVLAWLKPFACAKDFIKKNSEPKKSSLNH